MSTKIFIGPSVDENGNCLHRFRCFKLEHRVYLRMCKRCHHTSAFKVLPLIQDDQVHLVNLNLNIVVEEITDQEVKQGIEVIARKEINQKLENEKNIEDEIDDKTEIIKDN